MKRLQLGELEAELETLQLGPDDLLVVRIRSPIDEAELEEIRAMTARLVGSSRWLVVTGDIELAAIPAPELRALASGDLGLDDAEPPDEDQNAWLRPPSGEGWGP